MPSRLSLDGGRELSHVISSEVVFTRARRFVLPGRHAGIRRRWLPGRRLDPGHRRRRSRGRWLPCFHDQGGHVQTRAGFAGRSAEPMKKTFLFFMLVGLALVWISGYRPMPNRGTKLMEVDGVAIYFHENGYSERGEYGLEYQCVEFVNRWLAAHGHRNLTQTGDAHTYFTQARAKDLTPYANGGTQRPRYGDIIVFESSTQPFGHVGVIVGVTAGEGGDEVVVAQQNATSILIPYLLEKPLPIERFPLKNENGHWTVQPRRPLKCLGWSRP